jgi:transcriptional regulator with XRE-family HTH domain
MGHASGNGEPGSLGALLRRYRGAAGITQEELAERSGLSVQAISMLERGLRHAPRSSTIETLARALVLDPAQHEALVAAARERRPAAGDDRPADAHAPAGRGPGDWRSESTAEPATGTPGGAVPARSAPAWRPVLPWLSLFLLPLVLGLGLQAVLPGARMVGLALAIGGPSAVACAGLATMWLTARHRDERETADRLDRAADALAEQLALQWRQAAIERRLLNPIPIRVHWQRSDLRVAGPIADAVGDGAELPRFIPLPGIPAVTGATSRAGDLRALLAVYGGLDSGRLVILGEPGAGKTGAAIRLLLAALERRRSLAGPERSGVPVPVFVGVRGWDPATQPLKTWLALRLSEEHPFLRSAAYGRDVALRLVRAGRLAVILDGLDEMRSDLRSIALRALDEQATFRLVVLSRSQELVAAASEAHLSGAAAVELQPVDAEETAAYLERCTPQPLSGAWQRLLDVIRSDRGSPVARALDTPLALSLVRDTYGPGDAVDEMLDGDRFRCPEEVMDHLLDRVLPAAYTPRPGQPPPRHTLAQARRWLGFIAWRMSRESTGADLAWWLVPRWRPAWPRSVITITTVALVAGVAGGLAGGRPGALAVGAPVALAAALALLRDGGPPRQAGWPRWGRVLSRANLTLGFAVGLAGGLAFGVAVGLAAGLALGLLVGLLVGVLIGLAANLLFGLADGLGHLPTGAGSPVDPITSWCRDRQYVLALVAAFSLVGGVMGGLAWELTGWLYTDIASGLAGGLLGGLAIGVVLGLSGAFEGRLATALVGRLATGFARTIAFGLALGLAAGSAAALSASLADGLLFGFALGLGFGLAFALADSAAWPAALAFAQLAWRGQAPLRLLRFLEEARDRQVLRVAGPVYQFRHARLQERLARGYEDEEDAGRPRHLTREPASGRFRGSSASRSGSPRARHRRDSGSRR